MSQYLEEAAALLRKAAEANENDRFPLNGTRVELAMKFAQLGAIEKGLVPKDMADEFVAGVTHGGWSR